MCLSKKHGKRPQHYKPVKSNEKKRRESTSTDKYGRQGSAWRAQGWVAHSESLALAGSDSSQVGIDFARRSREAGMNERGHQCRHSDDSRSENESRDGIPGNLDIGKRAENVDFAVIATMEERQEPKHNKTMSANPQNRRLSPPTRTYVSAKTMRVRDAFSITCRVLPWCPASRPMARLRWSP